MQVQEASAEVVVVEVAEVPGRLAPRGGGSPRVRRGSRTGEDRGVENRDPVGGVCVLSSHYPLPGRLGAGGRPGHLRNKAVVVAVVSEPVRPGVAATREDDASRRRTHAPHPSPSRVVGVPNPSGAPEDFLRLHTRRNRYLLCPTGMIPVSVLPRTGPGLWSLPTSSGSVLVVTTRSDYLWYTLLFHSPRDSGPHSPSGPSPPTPQVSQYPTPRGSQDPTPPVSSSFRTRVHYVTLGSLS